MIVRELVTKLGFEADETKVKRFEGAVNTLNRGLTALVTGAAAAAGGAFALAKRTAEYGDEAAKTARVLNMSAEQLQEQRFAFDRAGVSATEFTSALEFMTRQTEYSANQLPELLDELADIEDANQRASRAVELFGRSGIRMGTAMAGGSAELAQLTEEFRQLGGGISQADAEASEEFMDTLTNMNTMIGGLTHQIGSKLFPVFTEIIKEIQWFIVTNKELLMLRLQAFFEGAIRITRQAIQIFRAVWRTVDALATAFGGWEVAIKVLGVAMLAAFAWAKPFIALAAIIGVLIDDFISWKDGADSVIGSLLGSFENFSAKMSQIFGGLFDGLADIWRGFMSLFRGDLDGALSYFMDGFTSLGRWILGLFKGIISGVKNTFISGIRSMLSFLPDWALDKIGMGDMNANIATEAMQSGSNSSSVTDNRRVEVNVPPGTTQEQAQYISREVQKAMGREYDAAALMLEY